MFLSQQELIELTGKKRRDAQVKALRAMGIEHKVRPDGSAAVLREHVQKVLDGALANAITRDVEPKWENL